MPSARAPGPANRLIESERVTREGQTASNIINGPAAGIASIALRPPVPPRVLSSENVELVTVRLPVPEKKTAPPRPAPTVELVEPLHPWPVQHWEPLHPWHEQHWETSGLTIEPLLPWAVLLRKTSPCKIRLPWAS